MVTMTSKVAQNSFGQLLDTAQREPVAITRHGRPAAYVVSPQMMDELLMEARRKGSKAAADMMAWDPRAIKSLSPSQAAAAIGLIDDDVTRLAGSDIFARRRASIVRE
jgi:prevent-host-death family protein